MTNPNADVNDGSGDNEDRQTPDDRQPKRGRPRKEDPNEDPKTVEKRARNSATKERGKQRKIFRKQNGPDAALPRELQDHRFVDPDGLPEAQLTQLEQKRRQYALGQQRKYYRERNGPDAVLPRELQDRRFVDRDGLPEARLTQLERRREESQRRRSRQHTVDGAQPPPPYEPERRNMQPSVPGPSQPREEPHTVTERRQDIQDILARIQTYRHRQQRDDQYRDGQPLDRSP
jgi:hypothetical protein